ncbi:hypothetical protein N9039_01355 [Verrucomicrobiales bacterium]|nr:hypothetical protein [Verrucomicrobiales bacterium]
MDEGKIQPLRNDFPSLYELLDVEYDWSSAVFSLLQGGSKNCHLRLLILKQPDAGTDDFASRSIAARLHLAGYKASDLLA